jgi:hypothetical protein
MPDRRLLADHGPAGRVWYHPQPDGTFLIEHEQDVRPNLDTAKRLQNEDDRGWSPSRELRRVAHIPNIIIVKWLNEEGLDIFDSDPEMQKRYRAKLNDPDWRWLRTAPGRI